VPRVWRASDYFGLILETDVENLTRLGSRFMTSKLSIDDGMEVVRVACEYCSHTVLHLYMSDNESMILVRGVYSVATIELVENRDVNRNNYFTNTMEFQCS
jgi:hypothetical protein